MFPSVQLVFLIVCSYCKAVYGKCVNKAWHIHVIVVNTLTIRCVALSVKTHLSANCDVEAYTSMPSLTGCCFISSGNQRANMSFSTIIKILHSFSTTTMVKRCPQVLLLRHKTNRLPTQSPNTPPSILKGFEVMKIHCSPAQTHACSATTTNTSRPRLADSLASTCESALRAVWE